MSTLDPELQKRLDIMRTDSQNNNSLDFSNNPLKNESGNASNLITGPGAQSPSSKAFIDPNSDPNNFVHVKVPGQTDLPEFDVVDPTKLQELKTKYQTNYMGLTGSDAKTAAAAADEAYKNYDVKNNTNYPIYQQSQDVKTAGTTLKHGLENSLIQYAQIPKTTTPAPLGIKNPLTGESLNVSTEGYFPGKSLVVGNPLLQQNPQALNYERNRVANGLQLIKDIAPQATALRGNMGLINQLPNMLPTTANKPEVNKDLVLQADATLYASTGQHLDPGVTKLYGITAKDILDRTKLMMSKGEQNVNGTTDTMGTSTPTGTPPSTPGPLGQAKESAGLTPDLGKAKQNYEDYWMMSTNLAKKAAASQDPKEINKYLAQSMLLRDMAAQQQDPEKHMNPVVYNLGKIQEFLGKSELLPAVGAMVGSAVIPIPGLGAAAGARWGEQVKQANAEGGIMSFLPTPSKVSAENKSAATYGIIDLLFFGGGKLLKPIKTISGLKSAESAKLTSEGVSIDGTQTVKTLKEWGNGFKVASSDQPAVDAFIKEAEKKFAGKTLTVDEALAAKAAAWSNAGKIGQGQVQSATQLGEQQVANIIRNQLPTTIRRYDSILTALISGQKVVKAVAPTVIKTGAGAVGLTALGQIGLNAYNASQNK